MAISSDDDGPLVRIKPVFKGNDDILTVQTNPTTDQCTGLVRIVIKLADHGPYINMVQTSRYPPSAKAVWDDSSGGPIRPRLTLRLRREHLGERASGLEVKGLVSNETPSVHRSQRPTVRSCHGSSSIALKGKLEEGESAMPSQPTKEKLAVALTTAGAPAAMIQRARDGGYDDYESESATPIVDLVNDACRYGLKDIVQRAMNGEFDGSSEEADAWFEREGEKRNA
jgi:hypothetical protein